MTAEAQEVRVPLSKPLAPIRCTLPKPCGNCWYCRVHDGRQAYGEVKARRRGSR